MDVVFNWLVNLFGGLSSLIQFSIWLVCFSVFIISLIVKKTKTKTLENEIEQIDKNKKNQEEEELNMAKLFFLCDRCGEKVNAEDGVKFAYHNKSYDFCKTCGKIIRDKIDEKSKAEINYLNAETIYNNAKTKLENIDKECEALLAQSGTANENASTENDIKKRLGI